MTWPFNSKGNISHFGEDTHWHWSHVFTHFPFNENTDYKTLHETWFQNKRSSLLLQQEQQLCVNIIAVNMMTCPSKSLEMWYASNLHSNVRPGCLQLYSTNEGSLQSLQSILQFIIKSVILCGLWPISIWMKHLIRASNTGN